jgi:hypothetical protein
MSDNPNFRDPKNSNSMHGTSGAGGNAVGSPADKKIRALAETIFKKLYAKYGELLKLLSPPELMEIIRLNFGDNPIGAMLNKPDPIEDALRQMYGKPISQSCY